MKPKFENTELEAITEDQWHASRGDQHRAMYDFLKHISTLDSGAILIIGTFIERPGKCWP